MSDSQAEANKAVLRRWIEMVSNGDLAKIDEVLSSDLILHAGWNGYGMGEAHGIEQMPNVFTQFLGAFPSAKVTIQRLAAEEDLVTTLYHVVATHTGDYFGIAPTGRTIEMDFLGMYRFSGGRIVEAWAIDDALCILDQLGVPPIATAVA
jgi:predicted ester cyclase